MDSQEKTLEQSEQEVVNKPEVIDVQAEETEKKVYTSKSEILDQRDGFE